MDQGFFWKQWFEHFVIKPPFWKWTMVFWKQWNGHILSLASILKEGLHFSCFPPEEIQQRCQIWMKHCTFLLNLSVTTFTDELFPRGIFLDITINFVSFHRKYFPQFPLPFITWSDIWRLKTINWFWIVERELFPSFLLPLSQTNGLQISLNLSS